MSTRRKKKASHHEASIQRGQKPYTGERRAYSLSLRNATYCDGRAGQSPHNHHQNMADGVEEWRKVSSSDRGGGGEGGCEKGKEMNGCVFAERCRALTQLVREKQRVCECMRWDNRNIADSDE